MRAWFHIACEMQCETKDEKYIRDASRRMKCWRKDH